MSFSFVRGFIHSAFGPLNSAYLPKFPPFPVRALDNMASRGEEIKGVDEGKEEKRDSLEPRTDQFHLLLQVLQSNGWPIMTGSFTGGAVVEMVQKYAGSHPIEVEAINDHDMIIQLEPTLSAGEAARFLHGTHDWFGQVAQISCLLSTQESIENIVADREEGRARLAELEKDQCRVQEEQEKVRQEQAAHTAHLEQVLAHFGQEVQEVEDLQKNAIMAASAAATATAHLVTAPHSVTSVRGSHVSTKINKPPVLPHFLGANPVPKDEGSYEQWRFQVVGAQKVCTEEAVHSAIVHSI